jgi:hypothetical protein
LHWVQAERDRPPIEPLTVSWPEGLRPVAGGSKYKAPDLPMETVQLRKVSAAELAREKKAREQESESETELEPAKAMVKVKRIKPKTETQ